MGRSLLGSAKLRPENSHLQRDVWMGSTQQALVLLSDSPKQQSHESMPLVKHDLGRTIDILILP